ncbi:hypothetical protein GTV32_14150 [Gordonia sp. SID5947]|uniref:hypothetical protein n=1 Tax=Gordonia sp. SID5947 TaxID=2690315 RepID=UPI00136C40A6|nr:hypothetical protein [Gordonia sp. SID5947]MYR07379.1 hypothetical protein [Gordonia sp. SID5947]
MGWATVRATARCRVAVAVVLVFAVVAVAVAFGTTSVAGLVVAVAAAVALAGWFAAGATMLIVSAQWRRMLPPGTPMSVHYERDVIALFLGQFRRIPLEQVDRVRELGTAIHITAGGVAGSVARRTCPTADRRSPHPPPRHPSDQCSIRPMRDQPKVI